MRSFFDLSQDHKVLQDSVRDFVNEEIKPLVVQSDEEHMIPDSLVKKMAEMGFPGSYLPDEIFIPRVKKDQI